MLEATATAQNLQEALEALPPRRLQIVRESSELDEEEVALVRRGLADLPVEIRDLADRILDDWSVLTLEGRTAAMLAFAQALAASVGACGN